MKLYRMMKAAVDGQPEVGPSARSLGVRTAGKAPHNDVAATGPGDPVLPGVGGMSAAPNDPRNLPDNRRPPVLGGFGKDPIWEIDTADLGADLQFRPDSTRHGLIGVSRVTTLAEYERALAATRSKWRRVIG